MLVTRIAPTPSGYLHPGNAVNALLTAWLARSERDGRLLLRIDDFDAGRVRPEYLADVFDTLEWLGIVADAGPRDQDDFHAHWSMAGRREEFRAARDRLLAEHPDQVFVCRCSRRTLGADGRCVAGCRQRGEPLIPEQTAVRLAVADDTYVTLGGPDGQHLRVAVPPGDHVLWRRDDLPAYQLGSVVADEALGVTAIVRGADLLASSALQLHLAALLPAPRFAAADLRHHAVLTGPDGSKLSKSAGAQAHPMPRTDEQRGRILRWAAELGTPIRVAPPG